MQPAAMGITCKDALLIFSQNQTLELQKEVDRLKLEIYHLKLLPLRECMKIFNYYKLPRACHCLACACSGRLEEDSDADEPHTFECSFKPEWETYLQSVEATVHPSNAEWPLPFGQSWIHGDTASCLYNIGREDWNAAGWGRPLLSLNSPRKKIWDKIVSDTDTWLGD